MTKVLVIQQNIYQVHNQSYWLHSKIIILRQYMTKVIGLPQQKYLFVYSS